MKNKVICRKIFDKVRVIIPNDSVQLFYEQKCLVLSGVLYNIWLMIDGTRTVGEIALDTGLNIIEVAKAIKYLHSLEVVEFKNEN